MTEALERSPFPSAVWWLATALACLAFALGHLLPGQSPASRLIRAYDTAPTAALQALAHLQALIAPLVRRGLCWARQGAMASAYPDLLAHLSLQVNAGASVLDALVSAPQAVSPPLRAELLTLAADLRVAPLPAGLERWAKRVQIPEARALAQTLIHQQQLGFPLAAALAREEAHCLSLIRQQARRRIQAHGAILAVVTAVLLFNTLVLYFIPAVYSLPGLSRP